MRVRFLMGNYKKSRRSSGMEFCEFWIARIRFGGRKSKGKYGILMWPIG